MAAQAIAGSGSLMNYVNLDLEEGLYATGIVAEVGRWNIFGRKKIRGPKPSTVT